MVVKEGYKQTEVGVIPEDWEVISLGKVSDIKTGPFGSALHAEDYVIAGTPIITVEHLGESSITHDNLPMVSDCDKKRLYSYTLKVNDIVFSRVGSVDRNARVTDSEDGWLFSGRLLRIRFDITGIDSRYLSYHFHFEPVRQLIRNIAVGQTMPSLNTKLLSTVEIVIPPLPEQKVIATALSDIDGLINSLTKLIEKKKNIKQGAMQELLTGKKRLDGFSGEWAFKSIGEIFTIKMGTSKSHLINRSGHYYIVDMGSVSVEGKLIVSKKTCYRKDFLNYGDLIMPKDDIGGGKIIGKVAFIDEDEKYVLGDHIYVLTAKLGNSIFLSYMINSNSVNKELMKKVSGSAQLGLSKKSMEEQFISFPDRKEQTAIATILADMDSEIETLQLKLNKYKSIKQGMVQELLTGRIRLLEGA